MKTHLMTLCFLLVSCATTHQLKTSFKKEELDFLKTKGNSTISGQALMRTVSGDIKTCAGQAVYLTPVTAYSSERVSLLYGGSESGFKSAKSKIKLEPQAPKEYFESDIKSICDAAGKFEFTKIPNGEYFLIATVTWGIPNQYYTDWQGGGIMQKISVKGENISNLILSR